MFSKEQLEKLKHMGSSGLTTKLAQHDGGLNYNTIKLIADAQKSITGGR